MRQVHGLLIILSTLLVLSTHLHATEPLRDRDALDVPYQRGDERALLTNFEVFEVKGPGGEQGWWSPFGSHFGYGCDTSRRAPGLHWFRTIAGGMEEVPLPFLNILGSNGNTIFPAEDVVREATTYPSHIEEVFRGGDVTAEVTTAFHGTDYLVCSVALTADATQSLAVFTTWPEQPDRQEAMEESIGGVNHLGATYDREPFDYYLVAPVGEKVTVGPAQRKHFVFVLYTNVAPFPRTCLVLAQIPYSTEAPQHVLEAVYGQESLALSYPQLWLDTFVEKLPEPPADGWEAQLYYRAALTLAGLKWAPYEGSPFGDLTASLPSKNAYGGHWLWDGAFHALGYVKWDPKLAREQLEILFRNQDSDTGSIPNFIDLAGTVYGDRSQPPVIAYVAWELYEETGDREFLERAYVPLVRFAEFWPEHRDADGDGLCGYGNSVPPLQEPLDKWESGWDTSPRWDTGCANKEAIDLNSWLVIQRDRLAKMARELGKEEEARKWKKSAADLKALVNTKMFDPENGVYYDLYSETDAFSKVLTPASFFPLLAEIPDATRAREMVERHLLDETKLWPMLPSVAFDHPAYTPDNYWRGPTWINLAYVVIRGLENYGMDEEADALRARVLEMTYQNNHLGEYYNSQTGESIGQQQYGWTAAFVMELLEE